MTEHTHTRLRVVRAGIDTYQQPVVYMHRDCPVCRSEGFAALTRVQMRVGTREVIATLNVVTGDHLAVDEVALSDAAWQAVTPEAGAYATFQHPEPAASAGAQRAQGLGGRRGDADLLGRMGGSAAHPRWGIELAAGGGAG
ncbi:MAG: thymidine phosphorylase, partial [Arenimonas sp.]|nr:thymidine phosphorylase [Arenimonas sp.]